MLHGRAEYVINSSEEDVTKRVMDITGLLWVRFVRGAVALHMQNIRCMHVQAARARGRR